MKKQKLKTVFIRDEIIISEETGEVLDVHTKKVQMLIPKKEDFALVYAELWAVILRAKVTKSDLEMYALLATIYADGAIFTINKEIKAQLSEKTGKQVSAYNNSTKKLLEYGFILTTNSDRVYRLNPELLFKGGTNKRNELLLQLIEV